MIDLDNTLGNRTHAVNAWVEEFCEARDLPVGAHAWIQDADNDGYSSRLDVFTQIASRFDIDDPVEELLQAYQQRVVALTQATPGAVECLRTLRTAGHTIAIVTNGSTKQQHSKIDALGLRPLVDAVIVSGDLGIKKPDPRIFRAAAEATQAPLAGSWMVGDAAVHDIVGGAAVGANTAWVHRGRTWSDQACTPTITIGDLSELAPSIAAHG